MPRSRYRPTVGYPSSMSTSQSASESLPPETATITVSSGVNIR